MDIDTPRVSIIILNWNGCRDTVECLESLYRISYPNYDVILVDNGSMNGSLEAIEKYAEGLMTVESKFFEFSGDNKPIKVWECTKDGAESGERPGKDLLNMPPNGRLLVIKNDKNYGFAEGNNIGIRYALRNLNPDYVLLLNNDTVVDTDFLRELVDVAESDLSIGFAGPKVFYYDFNSRDDVISVAGIDLLMNRGYYHRIGAGEVDLGQYDQVRIVDFVEGSCLLARSKALRDVGLLNSRYFAYWEETDLCVRGHEIGYKSAYVPKSRIWHKVSSSAPSTMKTYYMTRNRLWFMRQHANKKEVISFLAYFFTCYLFGTVRGYIFKRDIDSLKSFLKGVMDGVSQRV